MENIELSDPNLKVHKGDIISKMRNSVQLCRKHIKQLKLCTHNQNDLNSIFKDITNDSTKDPDKTLNYVKEKFFLSRIMLV